jgi:hypothetical protein
MVKAGTYEARAVGEVVLGESKEKGTPYIELFFEIATGPCAGQKVRWTSYFTERTQERTIEALMTAGWQGTDFTEFADSGLHGLGSQLVGIVVELEDWVTKEGEARQTPKVKWVNDLARGGIDTSKSMSGPALESFATRMNALAEGIRARHAAKNAVDFPPPPAAVAPSPARKAF